MEAKLVAIGVVSAELGTSVSNVRLLANSGVIPFQRTAGGHRRFDLDAARSAWAAHLGTAGIARSAPTIPIWHERLDLAGLAEDEVWTQVAPSLDAGDHARAILRHAFTEMLNNAIDHSDGTHAEIVVSRRTDTDRIIVSIADDGVGVFERVATGFGLEDRFDAVVELSKGKRTTAPAGHAGEGIFFTSKAVDRFRLEANGISWEVDNVRDDHAVGISPVTTGTVVLFEVDRETERDLVEVFRAFTLDVDGELEFQRSRPRVQLAQHGTSFVSRSEAKRVLAGVERFQVVDVDFAGVDAVGQGFVDELLRVWPAAHPTTRITPINMNAAVEFMVRRGAGR